MLQIGSQHLGDKSTNDYIIVTNKLWEDMASDLVIGKLPHAEEIAGIRILDKSRQDVLVRIEFWFKFPNADTDPRGVDVKNYVNKEYLDKYQIGTENFKFENHQASLDKSAY